jgi:hypothetical protein
MRKFLITVLLAGAAASPALAQDHGRHHGDDNNNNQQQSQGNHNRGDRGDRGDANEARQQSRDAVRAIANGGHADRQDVQSAVRDYQMRHQNQGGWNSGQQAQQAYQGNRGDRGDRWNGGATPAQRIVEQRIRQDRNNNNWNRQNGGYYGQGSQHYSGGHSRWANGGWDRNWRNNSRYDWRRYRNNHRSIFHLGFYYDPFGYGYSPFNIGYRLQPAYYGQRFWFDPGLYGLPYPPPGTQWVRYWNDAVLVDVYTGEVVDVIRDFFW